MLVAAAAAGLSVGLVLLFRLSVSYPVAGSTVTLLFGAIALVLVAYRLINPPGDGLDLEAGAWVGLVAAAGLAVGGYLAIQEPSPVGATSTG